MKKPSFKYYAINSLILLIVVSAGWVYFDYQQYSKFLNWQRLIESGEIKPIQVKLTQILKHNEKGSSPPSGSLGAQTSAGVTTHYVGHLIDNNRNTYKQAISYKKLSDIKVDNVYKLYKIGKINIIQEFTERTAEKYTISSAIPGLGIILLVFSFYLCLIYFALKLKK